MPCTLPFDFNNKLNLNQLSKIGKIRFMKSGKVILRIKQEGDPEGKQIDLDVSKGIQNSFYQQLVHLQKGDDPKISFMGTI